MNLGIVGKKGEDLTASFLRKNGWTVIKRNYYCRFGEIDIIAENDTYIIFVEVKTRRENSIVSATQAVDSFKQNKILLTAQDFLTKYDTVLQPRFDVAEVTVSPKNDGAMGFNLNYIENAF